MKCKGLPSVLIVFCSGLFVSADEPGPKNFVDEARRVPAATQQLLELVEQLEARIDQLEQRLKDVERTQTANLIGRDLLQKREFKYGVYNQPASRVEIRPREFTQPWWTGVDAGMAADAMERGRR